MNIWVYANGWPIPPTVLLGCVLAEVLYIRGWMTLAREELTHNTARTTASPALIGLHAGGFQRSRWFWRGIFFLAALFFTLAGDSAPVDILSARLFWVHMIQHLLLLVIIPPLLIAAAPLQPLWLGLPGWVRRRASALATPKLKRAFSNVGGWLWKPAPTCILFVVGIWIWHWPYLYDLALTNEDIHDWCEHLTFLVVSVLFWAQVIPSPPLRSRLGYLGKIAIIGVAILQNVALATLLGFAPAPLYAPYAHLATVSGSFSALQDQQLGAGIMWTFGDVPFGVALSIFAHRWFATQMDDAPVAIPSPRATER
jgi:cytochrome c oxidase assembly factor CtaG